MNVVTRFSAMTEEAWAEFKELAGQKGDGRYGRYCYIAFTLAEAERIRQLPIASVMVVDLQYNYAELSDLAAVKVGDRLEWTEDSLLSDKKFSGVVDSLSIDPFSLRVVETKRGKSLWHTINGDNVRDMRTLRINGVAVKPTSFNHKEANEHRR
jgi:hypothetical protein